MWRHCGYHDWHGAAMASGGLRPGTLTAEHPTAHSSTPTAKKQPSPGCWQDHIILPFPFLPSQPLSAPLPALAGAGQTPWQAGVSHCKLTTRQTGLCSLGLPSVTVGFRQRPFHRRDPHSPPCSLNVTTTATRAHRSHYTHEHPCACSCTYTRACAHICTREWAHTRPHTLTYPRVHTCAHTL